ncbi:hypothetical protein RCH14_002649 [Massilia sp. MP_M2]
MNYALKLSVCMQWVTKLVGNYEPINNMAANTRMRGPCPGDVG